MHQHYVGASFAAPGGGLMSQLVLLQAYPFHFYDADFTIHLASDRQFYVRLNDLCDAMGVSREGQRRRIIEDIGMSRYLVNIVADTVYQDGVRRQETLFLNSKALTYWLGSIDHRKLKPEVKERVAEFKMNFVDAVDAFFRSDIFPEEIRAEMDAYLTTEQRELARLRDQVRDFSRRLDQMEGKVSKIDALMDAVAIVNVQQQWQLQQMLHAVGEVMYESKGNKMPRTQCHALVQNDFKREFKVPVYSLLPESRMDDAVSYLSQRYQHLNPGQNLPEVFTDGTQQSLF